MKEFKGTKGVWHTMVGGFSKKVKEPNMIQVYATNDDLEMVCKVYKDGLLFHSEQDFEANAKLIASAPLLLEALQNTLSALEGFIGNNSDEWIEVIKAKKAISKALD